MILLIFIWFKSNSFPELLGSGEGGPTGGVGNEKKKFLRNRVYLDKNIFRLNSELEHFNFRFDDSLWNL